MTLWDTLCALSNTQYNYYCSAPEIDLNNLSSKMAYQFIKSTYKIGCKDKIFNIGFQRSFKEKGKHVHTLILYLLGCCLQSWLVKPLQNQLLTYIPTADELYDFNYVWYLTCLYHDTASVIENSEWHKGVSSDINFHLGKHNIMNNVYEHSWEKKSLKPYTYSENVIKNYFRYRVEYCHSIDHGILAGYLLYDRLISNYNETWKKYRRNSTFDDYNNFYYNGLCWRIEHQSLFAIVADAIIAHNIWHSDDKVLFQSYGLDSLVKSNKFSFEKNMSFEKNTLAFILGLLDTIEPTKFFDKESPMKVLKSINLECDNVYRIRRIKISLLDKLAAQNDWLEKLESMENWLNVKVDTVDLNTRLITIK